MRLVKLLASLFLFLYASQLHAIIDFSYIKHCTSQYSNNGALEVVANGNAGPFNFHWNTGVNTSQVQVSSINNLSPGQYSVTVTISNGCEFVLTTYIVSNGADISYICIENIGDVCLEKSIDIHAFNGYTMAHEIGHQFGLTHGFHEGANSDTDCATCVGSPCSKIGLMSADFEINEVSKGFIPLHLNLLRSRETNPKF